MNESFFLLFVGNSQPRLSARWSHIGERIVEPIVQEAVAADNAAGAALYVLGVRDAITSALFSDIESLIARCGQPMDGPGLVIGSTREFPVSIIGINRGSLAGASLVQLLVPDFAQGLYEVTSRNPLPATLAEVPGQLASNKRLLWTTYRVLRSEWTPEEREKLAELTRQAHMYLDPHRRREQF